MKLEINMAELNEIITLYDSANEAASIATDKLSRLIGLMEQEYDGGPYVCISAEEVGKVLGHELLRGKELCR